MVLIAAGFSQLYQFAFFALPEYRLPGSQFYEAGLFAARCPWYIFQNT
jgi:hypothetical protein